MTTASDPVCWICLGALAGEEEDGYHGSCLAQVFGQPRLPEIDLDVDTLPSRVKAASTPMSISGVQPKALMQLTDDGTRLVVADGHSRFILKPQNPRFGQLPENEHLSMAIGALVGLETPPFGLFRLADESPAYLVRRFDRSDESPPRGLRKIDLCQLSGRSSEQKDVGSAEECAVLVRRHTRDPARSLQRLFRLFLISFWIGNGDLHLKNISLVEPEFGAGYTLSPVYDLVSTAPYYGSKNPMLLAMDGRTGNLSRVHFLNFAGSCGLERSEAEGAIEDTLAHTDAVLDLTGRSAISRDYQNHFIRALRKRGRALRT